MKKKEKKEKGAKMANFLGFIGGSGIYNVDSITIVRHHDIKTPFGPPSAPIMECKFEGKTFYFLARHGEGHTISPSEINYRANIFGLKMLGVRYLVSLSAVGSLKEELAPRSIVLPDQFIDWTKGLRKRTFFEGGVVGHVSCAYPVERMLQERVQSACERAKVKYFVGGSYLCIEGPQFSSRAESEIYRSFGASVIGMTNVPEAYLAKEAAMAYTTVAMVTDYDCWRDEHCSIEEILKVLQDNYQSAQKIITRLVPDICDHPVKFDSENKFAVITKPEQISSNKQEIVDILLS